MIFRSHSRLMLAILSVYFLSSLVQAPVTEPLDIALPHVVFGPVVISPPLVLSGDSPHYLVIVNSLLSDGDLDVSNNYRQAERGGLDAGTRFRGVPLDHHADRTRLGREYSVHAPYLPLLLAALVWPLGGTPWVEPACIWLTMLAGIATIWLFNLLLERTRPNGTPGSDDRLHPLWLLALATPFWCYSRDLWTEAWTALAWTALLVVRTPLGSAGICFLGVLFRYPFALAAAVTGVVLWVRKQRRLGQAILSVSILSVAFAVLVAQFIYRDTGHFSLLHFGTHVDPKHGVAVTPFGFQLQALWGLLLDPVEGLLPFAPFLAWGIWQWRKGGHVYLPAAAYYVLISLYQVGWGAGTGFSARHLVPMVPVLVFGVIESMPRSILFRVCVAWSVLWAGIGGFFPALVYERSPLGVIRHVVDKVAGDWRSSRF